MRPSGLHVNKPVIFGILASGVFIFLAYRYWTRSSMAAEVVVVSESKLEPFPELTDEAVKSLKRESKLIDVQVGGTTVKIHTEQVMKDGKDSPVLNVLFLHGASFSSQNWLDIKSTDHVANWGHRAVAIDLPGTGKSPDKLNTSLKELFLDAFIKKLDMKNVVIIAPSASGGYALPYLFNSTSSRDRVVGFVPVAPVGAPAYRDKYADSKVPTLIVYGSDDKGIAGFLSNLELIPNHKVSRIEGAGHACYMDKPEVFHKVLFNFLKELAH